MFPLQEHTPPHTAPLCIALLPERSKRTTQQTQNLIKLKCFGQFLGNLKSKEMDLHHPYGVPIRKYTVGVLQAAEGRPKSVL